MARFRRSWSGTTGSVECGGELEQLFHCASASVLHTSQKSNVTWSAICLADGRQCTRVGVCEIAGAHREVRGVERGEKRREKVRVGIDARGIPERLRKQRAAIGPIRQDAQHDCRQSHEQRGSDSNRGAAGVGGFASIKAGEQKTVDGVGENNPEQDRPEAEDERTRVLPGVAGHGSMNEQPGGISGALSVTAHHMKNARRRTTGTSSRKMMPSTHVPQAGGWRKRREPADSALGDAHGDASGHDCWVNVSSH